VAYRKAEDSDLSGSKHSLNSVCLNLFENAVLICYSCFQMFDLCHIFKGFVSCL
jgi:hypothetical protein